MKRKSINSCGNHLREKTVSCRRRHQLAQKREIGFCLWAGLEEREMSVRITGMDVVVIAYDEGLNESIIQKKTEKVLAVMALVLMTKVHYLHSS